jgi:uncharacterized protein involved in copper resistance
MKQSYKYAAGVVASLGLGLAVATAYAHPGQMGGGTEHGKSAMKGGMQHGAKGGMQHGAKGGMQHGGMGGAGHGAGQQLMTPEERAAVQEKMRSASTPEERQQIAAANRAEMQKRAKEKGVTLHEGHGPRRSTTPQAPTTTEHQH